MRQEARMRGGLAALAVVAIILGLGFAVPAVAAVGCPTCFGFDRLADGLHVDASASPDQREQVREITSAARSPPSVPQTPVLPRRKDYDPHPAHRHVRTVA